MQSTASDRIVVIDVLRAVALFGILVTHIEMGFLAGMPRDPLFDIHGPLDAFVAEAVRVLAAGKFFSIFSFLFGLSFAIQLDRARAKGNGFAGRFAWRLAILFGIGFVHSLFFNGDILTIYALLGLALIPMNVLGTKLLAVIAIVLVLNVPGIARGYMQVTAPPPTAEQQAAAMAARTRMIEMFDRHFEIKTNGTVAELMRVNATEAYESKLYFQVATGRLWMTYGFFLLGLCAGRANLFVDTPAHRRFFKRLAVWAGIPAVMTTALAFAYPSPMRATRMDELWAFANLCVQQATLPALYAAIVVLLHWKAPRGWFAKLAPLGKMGLTTYLVQSAFGVFVFYGFGLGMLGKIGVATCVALGIAFFFVQALAAHAWLRYFNMGPIEWLWRALTYFRLRPNARAQTSPA